MDPVEGGVYKDDKGRLLSVHSVRPDQAGRDVQGYLLESGRGSPVRYSTSLGIFRAVWKERVE